MGEVASCLDAALLDAHATTDDERLARLYTRAADEAEAAQDVDAACFFLTQAWVFALQANAPDLAAIEARLVRRGRLRSTARADVDDERSEPSITC